ncbi:ATP-binding cassette domain-containing protein [Variovorax sp. J22R115]|uniref:ABC transporter ATP-binding protein n=1 Tax=Variovorax sp. J22R115 TaxID=3053509 RepID=UPI002575CA34|nr:ATP-binding cassette domain-containing protein [Variovorax sp. J22R115]MDM0049909.1 ATP-binding cassette domain-containing protein [Variovorax sp. J22R115]
MNSAASEPILVVKDLCFAYPGHPPLLSGWSASIGAGLTQLYGDDGSGKSTILRLLAGRLAAKGELTLARAGSSRDLKSYQRSVFFVDPATDEFDEVTATDCTSMLRASDAGFDEARWGSCVAGFSLAPHLAKPMYMLSTGSKRKVWLAAALASGRALTLLDEPTAGLDNASIRFLWRALADVAGSSNRAIVVASAARLDAVPLSALIELPLHAS